MNHQIVTVFAVESHPDIHAVTLNPAEHSAYEWPPFDRALDRVHYRGLKDGPKSVAEYVTASNPAAELRLR